MYTYQYIWSNECQIKEVAQFQSPNESVAEESVDVALINYGSHPPSVKRLDSVVVRSLASMCKTRVGIPAVASIFLLPWPL